MTYRFTIVFMDSEGTISQVKLREHSREKARRRFRETHPNCTIISIQ